LGQMVLPIKKREALNYILERCLFISKSALCGRNDINFHAIPAEKTSQKAIYSFQ